jgi:hypothetical protein
MAMQQATSEVCKELAKDPYWVPLAAAALVIVQQILTHWFAHHHGMKQGRREGEKNSD